MPAVGAGITTWPDDGKAGQEVCPPVSMAAHLGVWKTGMAEVESGATSGRRKPELDS